MKAISPNRRYVCWNIQLTSELIAAQEELGQIDEVTELFGQFACKKQKGGMSAKRTNTCMLEHTTLGERILSSPDREFPGRSRTVKFARSPSALHSSPTAIHKTKSGHRESFLIITKSNETKSGMAL